MSTAPEWHLVQTKARQEALAREHLERQGYRTWLPRLRLRTRRGPRVEPMFPGYLCVRLCPDVDDFGPVRSTVGVLRLVRFGGVFARIPDDMVAEIDARAAADGVCEPPERPLEPGDRVEIVDGALAGYAAVVASVRRSDRIALLLDIAGRHVSVVASRNALEAL